MQSFISFQHCSLLLSLEKEAFCGDVCGRLSELAVEAHVKNLTIAPAVQRAWKANQELTIQGMMYSLESGLLKPIGDTVVGDTLSSKKSLK